MLPVTPQNTFWFANYKKSKQIMMCVSLLCPRQPICSRNPPQDSKVYKRRITDGFPLFMYSWSDNTCCIFILKNTNWHFTELWKSMILFLLTAINMKMFCMVLGASQSLQLQIRCTITRTHKPQNQQPRKTHIQPSYFWGAEEKRSKKRRNSRLHITR